MQDLQFSKQVTARIDYPNICNDSNCCLLNFHSVLPMYCFTPEYNPIK